jgi:prepilin-type processing-associated H-X9-DG protein
VPFIDLTGNLTTLEVGLTNYVGVLGTDAASENGCLFLGSAVRFSDITDGTSNTLLVGERPPNAQLNFGGWYAGIGQSDDGDARSVLGVTDFNIVGPIYGWDCMRGPYEFGPGRFDSNCDVFHFWSPHAGGANFLMADGSVHFLAYSAAPLMPSLATRAGGEPVQPPD